MGLEKRNYGIDLLRIVSMMMVVLLHVLGAGGVLGSAEKLSLNYEISWFLETAAYCSVNCYAMISGYVGYRSKHSYANLAVLWLQVALCSVGVHLIFALIQPETLNWQTMLRAFFPVMNNYGWYFTCYFALFFFMPLLNHVINTMDEKALKGICLSGIGVLSLLGTGALQDIFQLKDGYSVLWLGALYLLGGCMGRFGWFHGVKKRYLGLIYGACVILAWSVKYLLEAGNLGVIEQFTYSEVLIRYKSPAILIAAMALVVLFAKVNVPNWEKGPIQIFATTSFGVYILHMHPQIWDRIIVGKYASFAGESAWLMVLKVIGITMLIYLAMSALDSVRHLLFQGLRLKQILKRAENKIKERM